MPLTSEEIKELKEQLHSQIKNLPPDKKAEAEKQISSMSTEALESMLKQQQSSDSIFRMIVKKETDSVIVGENSEALAVLDINPISRGHTMIIPKKAVSSADKIPKAAFALAQELTNKITSNLKAKETKAETNVQFGEAIIHLIPIYDKPLSLSSKREKASKEDLESVKRSLEVIKIEKKVEKIKVEEKKPEPPIKMKRRVP